MNDLTEDEQPWDETESDEDQAARLEHWLEFSRSMWLIFNDLPFFMGVWEVEDPLDEDTGQMLLKGLPDWPEARYQRIEVHKLPPDHRPDKYNPDELREHAFEHVMAIRPVEKPITREKKGDVTLLRLDQEPKITHLRLYGKIYDI